MATYDVEIKIETVLANIEAQNIKEAIKIAKEMVQENWNIELRNKEIVSITKNG
jgi:head-tail adaptor